MKIQPRMRSNKYTITKSSEIKLCGNWLEELGFIHGKRVVVTMMRELLIIRVAEE
jgi:hypothetical protein